ncbi:antichymotrypsin-2-like [Haematobia irritans]|uniref:antichymotrypsin-2-like n=1 Tax=Haematobia irritans TaxID=7368 RepID=UPI003F5004E9
MQFLVLVLSLLAFCVVINGNLEAKEFTLEYIQHILNRTNEDDNVAVAPYAAYKLYEELFESNDVESFESENNDDQSHMPPAIIKHQYRNETFVEQNITMKARWTFNFQTRDTSKRPFHQLDSEDHTYLVDNLRKDDVFRYTFMEELNASILELPLHLHEVKLLIILPKEENALEDLKEYLVDNMYLIEEISRRTFNMTLVRVMLPKFALQFEQNLREFFDEISDEEIMDFEDIHQITTLKFKEHGIGDFEKITVLFWNAYSYLRIAPTVVDISHPFLFMITDEDGIQFFGQVVKCGL